MLRYCLAAVVAMAGIAAPALAQDEAPEAKAATGFRIEAIAGYEDASFDSVRNGSGALYGVGVGYDLAAGRFRFGLEAEASDSTADDCSVFAGGNTICSKAGRDLYAGARVGGMISDNVLLYGKVGYTNYRFSSRFTFPAGGPVTTHPEVDGLRLGAGTEIAVGAKTFVKAEYRFSNYEAADNFDKHQAVVGFGLRF